MRSKLSFGICVAAVCCPTIAFAQGALASSGDTNSLPIYTQTSDPPQLNCTTKSLDPIPLDHIGTFASDGYSLSVSVSSLFGGIGTGLSITNLSNGATANVIEDRSGAGAGWQTSYFLYDHPSDVEVVFNQAAGNSEPKPFQWGYSNSITSLSEFAWNDLASDHYVDRWSVDPRRQTGSTPCGAGALLKGATPYKFDQGRGEILVAPIQTPFGPLYHIINGYDIKSVYPRPQFWTWETFEQALYLDKAVAAENNLRVYLVGTSGWVDGPIAPSAPFSVSTTHSSPSECGQKGCVYCDQNGCLSSIADDLSYMLLIWNVGGVDYGLAITNHGLGAQLGNETEVYCHNPAEASCGNIEIHTWLQRSDAVTVAPGEIRSLRNEYYVGTMPQLRSLGFSTDGLPGPTNYTTGFATHCNEPSSVFSNNEYPGDPAANLVSGSGFYSSKLFRSNLNDAAAYLVITFDKPAGHLKLRARVIGGQPIAFPDEYYVYVHPSAGGDWTDLGLFNAQPDNSGSVDIPLGIKMLPSTFKIVPLFLHKDNTGGYYMQLARAQACD